jgi:hypothetical protein
VPPRSPLPSRANRVVNPGAPDKKRTKCTSEEMATAAEQKNKLKLELERIEREKIRMLAEMEEVEEQEQRDEEEMRIKDIVDLAESNADEETDAQYNKEGMASDNDIEMADGDNDEEIEVIVDAELDGPDMAKSVSKLVYGNFVDDFQCSVQQKKKAAARKSRTQGDIRAAVDKEKGKSRQQRFFS